MSVWYPTRSLSVWETQCAGVTRSLSVWETQCAGVKESQVHEDRASPLLLHRCNPHSRGHEHQRTGELMHVHVGIFVM